MASDSDLEAYLNQLSKKTYSLKQDVNTLDYTSSRPTSGGDKSSDALNLSNENYSLKRDTRNTVGQGVFTSDITALSEKYGRPKYKNSQLFDEFSNLEKKYLKKSKKKSASRLDSPEVSSKEIDDKSTKISDSELKRHSRMTKAASTKQKDNTSCDSSVDDELARYLNESSLIDSHKEETERGNVNLKSPSSSNSSVAESDEVINLDNIMTVDDIMGQLSEEVEDDGNDHTECKESNNSNSLENAHLSDFQNEKNTSTLFRNETSNRKASLSRNKSLLDVENGNSPSGSKEDLKKKIMKSSEGLFYPNTEVKVKDNDVDKMEGLLFTQASDNVFHSSSRRNSLMMSPVFRRKSSTKSLLSVSFHDLPDKNGSEDSTEISVAESVVENISSSHEGSVSEAISERNSENVIAEYSEDFEATDNGKSLEKTVVKPKKNLVALPKTDIKNKEIISRKVSTDIRRSSADLSCPVMSYCRKDLKSGVQDSSLKASDNDDNVSRDILDKEEKCIRKDRERIKKSHSHKKSRKKSRKKTRHRSTSSSSSSSSSSSTSTSSSSFSSSSYLEKYRDASRRHRRKKHKSKKHFFNPLISSPHMYPWWWSQVQQHSSPAAAENVFHPPNPRLLEGWIPSSTIVGVEDIMRQQVALTRQFMESQQALYHAYTSTLTSSYHYTSLKDTEKYIKKKKQPLTFDEAYRLVKEEMNDAGKKRKQKKGCET